MSEVHSVATLLGMLVKSNTIQYSSSVICKDKNSSNYDLSNEHIVAQTGHSELCKGIYGRAIVLDRLRLYTFT